MQGELASHADMKQTALTRIYSRYVPRLIIERLIREHRAVDAPSAEGFQGAVLFADISGFTPLTETFAAQGPAGAEALTRILNDYFGRMTEIVFDHGGDVLKFAGDALMALWRPGSDAEGLPEACLRATRCGLDLQAGLAGYEAEGHPLSLKVAIGVGDAVVVHVGGQFNRWEFAIAGAPLNQVGQVGDLAERGDVLVSSEVWAQIGQRADGSMVLDEDADPEATEWPARRIRRVDGPNPRRAKPPPDLPPELEDALRGYLPASITRRIIAGQTDFLGELRRLTILFVNLPGITHETPLEVGQQAFRGLQKALYLPWEGSINKLSVDDKGISLVAALGLPPFAHEDDPARGAQAAMAMHQALSDMGQRCSIGVTTGRVYCGSMGGSGRQEYTIMGDRVNLAARLMQHADGGILCDEATVERSRDQVRYSDPETISVKGKAAPLPVYRPEGARDRASGRKETDVLIGRTQELAVLDERLEALVDQGRNAVIYLEGEAGVGKSRLIQQFVANSAADQPVTILEGAGDAIEQSTSLFAWQHVLLDMFQLHGEPDADARRARILDALQNDQAALELVPLLNGVLPLEIPETELTRQMSGEVRASNLQTLFVNLLQFSATRRPVLLILDDTHWMDSASWELVRNCVQRVSPLMVVLGSRPVVLGDAPEALRSLVAHPACVTMRLERMDPEECIALVAHRLKVDGLPQLAADLIRDRGEGHPYFSEEIGYALRDSGALVVEDGKARMARSDLAIDELDLPDTIEGIITSRIDRLTPQQQLALKVASCIGRVFSMKLLRDIYPVDQDRAQLFKELESLARLDLTPVEAPDPEPQYIFKHAITRQVAYDLMLYAQRKQLHEAIALWYEFSHADDLSAYYSVLAHHWIRADNAEKAVHYLPLAAERAMRANANLEVIEFIQQARARIKDLPKAPDALTQARWSAMLGMAQNALGRLDEARTSFEDALALSGYPAPGNTLSLVGAILNEIRIQAQHRRNGLPPPPADADTEARLALAADTVERLFMVYFFANDSARLLWTVLRCTNLGEAIGRETPILIRCYTDVAAALVSVPLQKQAEYYSERAMDLCEKFPDALQDICWAHLGTSAGLAATGQWSEIERRSMESLQIARDLGDLRRGEECTANLGLIRTIYGRYDDPEDSLYLPVLESARKRGTKQTEGWGLTIWGMNLHYKQRFDALDDLVRELEPWYETSNSGMDDIACMEALFLILSAAQRRGDDAAIDRWLTEGFRLMANLGRPTQYRVLPAVYLFTEAVIDWWQAAPDAREARLREKRVKRQLAYLKTYASIFPIGVPRLLWLRGRHAWYAGDAQRAVALWRECQTAAGTLEMAYDMMLSALALSRCLPDSAAEERAAMAEVAADLCEEMDIPGSAFVPEP
ncbi:MAG TPA: adenylate/guanylate cyclase domain-containing protein [Pseudomonadales bacterium]|nr:adenylate/guanylate cyclase domain-containing protein [Pseudomonadales bacterium]